MLFINETNTQFYRIQHCQNDGETKSYERLSEIMVKNAMHAIWLRRPFANFHANNSIAVLVEVQIHRLNWLCEYRIVQLQLRMHSSIRTTYLVKRLNSRDDESFSQIDCFA